MGKDIISKRFFDRTSKDYGKYRVSSFIELRGKTKVPYYTCKFKDTGNVVEVPLKTILEDRVIDIISKKKKTKKKGRRQKKDAKKEKFQAKRFIVSLKTEPVLLSLDISSHSTGYAIFKKGKLEKYGYFYQSMKEKQDTKRINYIKNEILKLITTHGINCVAIEDVIFKHKRALYVLSKMQGIILDYLFENSIKWLLITPIEWKTLFDINQNSDWNGANNREVSKKKTIALVNKKYNLNLEEEFKDHPSDLKEPSCWDVSDAIAIGHVALKNRINTLAKW